MLFSDIIGQSRPKQFLSALVQSGRVPHALLFLGPTGGGSLALALAFAQMLQCEHMGAAAAAEEGPSLFGDALPPEPAAPPAAEACGACGACRKAAALVHPDVHFSFPTVGTNAVSTDFLKEWRAFLGESAYADANTWLQRLGAENKQGNINKEECNAIVKKLSLKTFEGRHKVLLMWLPEYLGKEGNRLLKLIEEPPEQTVFLLVAENQELILNTILSRCQLLKTDPLSDEDVAQALCQQHGVERSRAEQIAFLAGGNLGTALAMVQHPDHDDARMLLDWFRRCWKGHAVELVRWTETFAQLGRENQKQFLHYALHFLREMLALMVRPEPASARLQPDELATAQNMARVLNFDKIGQMAALLNDNIYYVERNANPKILFLETSIRLNRIMKS